VKALILQRLRGPSIIIPEISINRILSRPAPETLSSFKGPGSSNRDTFTVMHPVKSKIRSAASILWIADTGGKASLLNLVSLKLI
jgi:hypothetical protein